jgi:MtfA peptidase
MSRMNVMPPKPASSWLSPLVNFAQRLGWASKPIPEPLWQSTLASYPFLAARPAADLQKLRTLSARFLARKEFTGAHGLVVSDRMALAVAAQACLPVLHMGNNGHRLYDDFTTIVLHPGAMLARRTSTDGAGVVHQYLEALAGEAMQGGPVTLSWQSVASSGDSSERGHNVVIHEFAHKLDMRDGTANGCPPLPSRTAQAQWQAVMQNAYANFRTQVAMADRFGGEPPWLDAYGATAPAEFFAVACEAYFVNRPRFAQDFAEVTALFDAYFHPSSQK